MYLVPNKSSSLSFNFIVILIPSEIKLLSYY
nr:MAG TPA: hypothetical protein [Bacteriophage sp.]